MSFADFIAGVESPTGEDNRMGSGAFSKYQFMPATAAALAQRTAWGRGLTPATVKAAVASDPARLDELFNLYTADSRTALRGAGIPFDKTAGLALHRFGQGGGVSLLKAPATMSVADWVKSVNWGPGVAADAVIRQNRLDRYANVGDLRRGFLGGSEAPVSAGAGVAEPGPMPLQQPGPSAPVATLQAPLPPLASLFSGPSYEERRAAERAENERRKALLFG